jgi:hypothetical protein
MAAFGAAVANPLCPPALGQPALSSGSGGANPYDPFPYAGNTGVPAGTVLAPSDGFTVSTANQTYTGLDIDGTVTIASGGTNATFQNCRITVGDTAYWAINNSAAASGLTVRNCTFVGAGVNSTVVNYAIQPNGPIFMCDGCHFSGFGQPINFGLADRATIQNNYIHGLDSSWSGTVHFEDIYVGGTSTANPSLTIQNNTMVNEHGWTAALFMKNNVAAISNVIIRNNLMIGGGYTTYCDDSGTAGGAHSNVQYLNNAMVAGRYGYVYPGIQPVVWTGNYNWKTKAAIPMPRK